MVLDLNGATKEPTANGGGTPGDEAQEGDPRRLLDCGFPDLPEVRELAAEQFHQRCVDLSLQMVSAEKAGAPRQVVVAIERRLDEAWEQYEDVRFGEREDDR